MFELYINDILMDVPAEAGDEILLEYSILTVDDIDKRSSNKSFTFQLPKTANNLAACENSQQVDNLTKFTYRRLKARAFEDGVDLKIRFAELSNVGETLEMKLYGANADFFQLIKDLDLSDFDFTGQNHFWDFGTISLNMLNTKDSTRKFIYPIIDYHEDSPNTLINNVDNNIWTKGMFVSLFYRNILAKIIAEQGYTLENEIDTDPNYTDIELLFPYSGESYVRDDKGERYVIKVMRNSNYATGLITSQGSATIPWDKLLNETDYFKQSPFSNWVANEFVTIGGVIFADQCKVSGEYKIILRNSNPSPVIVNIIISTDYAVQIPFPSPANTVRLDSITLPTNVDVVLQGTFTDLITDFENDNKDYLGIKITYSSGIVSAGDIFVQPGTFLDIQKAEIITPKTIVYDPASDLGMNSQNYLTIGSIFGTQSQLSLIANYCKIFGLLLDVDNDKKIVKLYKFNAIPANLENALDWSDKLDLSTDAIIEFLNNNYGKKSNLVYVIDKQEYYVVAGSTTTDIGIEIEENPTGTQGVIVIDTDLLEDEKDVVALDFAATVEVHRLIHYKVNQIPVIKDGDIANSKTQRILIAKRVEDADNSIVIEDGIFSFSATNFALTRFIDKDEVINLGFGNSLQEKNYGTMENVLQNYKLLKLPVRLNCADINQLDFKRPVYFSQFDSYFYVSKIVDYSPTKHESTTVELVKLNING